MRHRQFLVPVSAAVTTLLTPIPSTASVLAAIPQESSTIANGVATSNGAIDPILQRLTYEIRDQTHALTLHNSPSGEMYAAHGSHRSHADHFSHRSGS